APAESDDIVVDGRTGTVECRFHLGADRSAIPERYVLVEHRHRRDTFERLCDLRAWERPVGPDLQESYLPAGIAHLVDSVFCRAADGAHGNERDIGVIEPVALHKGRIVPPELLAELAARP